MVLKGGLRASQELEVPVPTDASGGDGSSVAAPSKKSQ